MITKLTKKQEWYNIDDDIKEEIINTWANIIRRNIIE